MKFPTPGDYQEAVQFPDVAFLDPDLRESKPEVNALGLPRAVTGAFAVVFPMQSRGARWAARCFLRIVRDQHERYRSIGAYFERTALPCTVGFEYVRRGVVVNGRTFPVLKMEWVDGVPLNLFVQRHLGDEVVLSELLVQWRRVLESLRAAGIAHGDLQHGNVLVTGSGRDIRLRLVDYDTAFVPDLRNGTSREIGHRNYQHPDRDESDFGPYLDHFASLVIDTAIQACRYQPDLWDRFDTGENLLLRAVDYHDPGASILFSELRSIGEIREQVEALEHACYLEAEAVPPLSDVVAGAALPAARTASPRRAHPDRSDVRGTFERAFLPTTAAVLTGLLVLAGLRTSTSLVPAFVVPILAALTIAAVCTCARWHHCRLPSVRRRGRLAREDAFFARLTHRLHADLKRFCARREDVLRNENALRESRLREIQEKALYDHLKHHFTGDAAQFDGITHKAVVRLKASGIRTAYQATPYRVACIRQMSDETKARINLWRASLAAQYASEVPDTLSPADERRLRRSLERKIEGIDRESARIREKVDVHEREREQIARRMKDVNAPTFAKYLGFLLRLR